MSKAAIVTGASSGIGLAISRVLCEKGYEVYGFGRDFAKEQTREFVEQTAAFHPVEGDLLEEQKLCDAVKEITKTADIEVLVNAAGVGHYGLHEELTPKKIQALVRTNLEIPLLLTNRLLRVLKKNHGYIINISSVTAKQSSPHGCAYAATKAGLSSFGKSLFEEARKYGVKVTTIHPDMTDTNLYRDADFTCGEEPESYLLPDEVAWLCQRLRCGRSCTALQESRMKMGKELSIRTASAEDAAGLLEIYRPYVEHTAITFEYEVPTVGEFEERITNTLKRYPYLVAEKDHEMVGYAYVSPFKERAAYDWSVETSIYVRKEAKQQGIGRRLYDRLEQILRQQGILNANACIAYPQIEDEYLTKDSVRFHEKLGYEMVGTFHQCGYKFGRWYDMVWMEKMIGEHRNDQPAMIPFPEIGDRIG